MHCIQSDSSIQSSMLLILWLYLSIIWATTYLNSFFEESFDQHTNLLSFLISNTKFCHRFLPKLGLQGLGHNLAWFNHTLNNKVKTHTNVCFSQPCKQAYSKFGATETIFKAKERFPLLPTKRNFLFPFNSYSATTVTGPLRQGWPIGLQENNNTFQGSLLRANQQVIEKNNKLLEAQNLNIDSKRFSREQNVSPDNVFLLETLHITHRRHICLRQAVILSFVSTFFATIVALCSNMRPHVKITTNVYIFRLRYTV